MNDVIKNLLSDKSRQILDAIERNPLTTISEISRELNLNYHTVRWHVKELEEKGVIQKQYKINLN